MLTLVRTLHNSHEIYEEEKKEKKHGIGQVVFSLEKKKLKINLVRTYN